MRALTILFAFVCVPLIRAASWLCDVITFAMLRTQRSPWKVERLRDGTYRCELGQWNTVADSVTDAINRLRKGGAR